MNDHRIRRRIAALRKQAGMKQDQLAHALGFKDRQTVSAIETGERQVSAAELVQLAEVLDVDLSFFSDPFILVDEGSFSWRRNEVPAETIERFELRAGSWLALYRHLSRAAGAPVNSLVPRLDLTERSSFEEAAAEGEAIAMQLELTPVPAVELEKALTEKLGALVLQIDAPDGISGAACRLGGLNVILVNRSESMARRAFNMAHELFHLATWDHMPPEHIESIRVQGNGNPRAEQLANAFAGGLLVPRVSLKSFVGRYPRPEPSGQAEWIRMLAGLMNVSGQAMKWRLKDLGYLRRAEVQRIDDNELRVDMEINRQKPPPFSRGFMERLSSGIEHGQLTVRKAAQVMGLTIDEMKSLFEAHGIPIPFDL